MAIQAVSTLKRFAKLAVLIALAVALPIRVIQQIANAQTYAPNVPTFPSGIVNTAGSKPLPCSFLISYWNAELGISLGDGGAADGGAAVYSWTDQCNGYVVTQATNADEPLYTATVYNGHHAVVFTGDGAQALNAVGSSVFPAVPLPYTIGATFTAPTAGLSANAYWVDFGTTAAKVSIYSTSSNDHTVCYNGVQTLTGSTSINEILGHPAVHLCSNSLISNISASGEIECQHIWENGLSFGYASCISSVSTLAPDGGVTIGNEYNGASATGSAAGALFAVYVASHVLTLQEQIALESYEQSYWGL